MRCLPLLLLFLLTACQSATEPPSASETLDSFRQVDERLRRGDTLARRAVIPEVVTAGMDETEKGFAIARLALRQLQTRLQERSGGNPERVGPADSLLVIGTQGRDLYDRLRSIDAQVPAASGSGPDVLSRIGELPADEWLRRHFKGLSTLAAITILRALEHELEKRYAQARQAASVPR